MKSWIIATAVTGIFVQPVLTLAAALPIHGISGLSLFVAINALLIFALVAGGTELVRFSLTARPQQVERRRQPRQAQPHLHNRRRFEEMMQAERRDTAY